MSSKTLSAVIEKNITRLGLNDFPCGNGSWRRGKDDPEEAATESIHNLLDLLRCPQSPWFQDNDSWSPQASELRELAVRDPQCLKKKKFIYSYFTALRILGKDVSVIDEGLLKFSKLEELILSANLISEVSSENLPRTLKILELRANRLPSLSGLTNSPPPQLKYLGLASNSLGSHEDIFHLTGRHWPQLVSLDLSDCEFQNQQVVLTTLKTLPSLKALVLKGNPFALAPAYPGFTVDSLPQLCCLDSLWIFYEERFRFQGLAKMNDLIEDVASVTVSLSSLRGIPNPQICVDKKAPDFPFINYTYFISYQFLSHHTSDNKGSDSESKLNTASHVTEDESTFSDRQSDRNWEREVSILHSRVSALNIDDTIYKAAHLSQYRTSKVRRSECMDLGYMLTHTVSSLSDLKKFLKHGLHLNLEEEKILSWPAASEDVPRDKANLRKKGGKGKKEEKVKSASNKDKPKDKKNKSPTELVQDPPIRRVLASVHIPLQSLLDGSQRVTAVCDFGPRPADSEMESEQTQKDPERESKGKKSDEKKAKQSGTSGLPLRTATTKAKGKDSKKPDMEGHTNPPEPATVELSVELEKWKSASEAHRLIVPGKNT